MTALPDPSPRGRSLAARLLVVIVTALLALGVVLAVGAVFARPACLPVGLGGPTTTRTVLAVAGPAAVVGVCVSLVRRRLRPLRRVAARADAIARTPLDGGRATDLARSAELARVRVTEREAGYGSEAARIGVALDHLLDQVAIANAGLVRAEERARRSEEQVRRSEERMRRFLSDAGHELRTPLAAIAGYAELMNHGRHGVGPLEPEPAWRRVMAESARMTGLVEDLLLLARLDEGHPLQSTEVDLPLLVTEAMWKAQAVAGGHVWRLELRPDAPALVVGDEARLSQVVARLLANAHMHTPVGTTVVASVEATSSRCVVRIRDDGPGIAPDLLPVVFEPFTRADPSRARADGAQGGSGLGLAVVAAVVAAHGGRTSVESAPGRTEFVMEVPRPGRNRVPGETGRVRPVVGEEPASGARQGLVAAVERAAEAV